MCVYDLLHILPALDAFMGPCNVCMCVCLHQIIHILCDYASTELPHTTEGTTFTDPHNRAINTYITASIHGRMVKGNVGTLSRIEAYFY